MDSVIAGSIDDSVKKAPKAVISIPKKSLSSKGISPDLPTRNKLLHPNGSVISNKKATRQQKTDLRLGDCREILKELETNSVHMVLTDPPYFLDGLDSEWRKGKSNSNKKVRAIGGLPVGMKFDPAQGRHLQNFMQEVSNELRRILVPGGFFLSFSQPRLAHRMAVGMEDAGFEIRDLYAWHFTQRAQMKAFSQFHFIDKMDLTLTEKRKIKKGMEGRKTPQLRPQFEAIIMAQNPKEGTFVANWEKYKTGLAYTLKTLNGTAPSTVMKVEKPTKEERGHGHMTPKPIKLLSHLIELFSQDGQTVLDPFLGSGSTAVAAVETNRDCIGIEIQKDYLELSRQRVKKMEEQNDRR